MLRLVESRWDSVTQHWELETPLDELGSIRATLEAAGDHDGLVKVWGSVWGEHWGHMRATAAAEAAERAADEAALAENRPEEDVQRALAPRAPRVRTHPMAGHRALERGGAERHDERASTACGGGWHARRSPCDRGPVR